MAKFSEVLKNRNFSLLWLGQIISQLGDRLGQVALADMVYRRAPGSTLQLMLAFITIILPVFVIGPVAGVYVDRWDRRKTMYVCDLLRAALVLSIPPLFWYTRSLAGVYVILFVVFCIGRFFVPAKLSIVPDLVKKEDLLIANSLVNITGMLAAILGFGISAMVVAHYGAESGFYIDSLSFIVSAGLIFLIMGKTFARMEPVKVSRQIVEVIRKSIVQEMKEGVLYCLRHKEIKSTAGIFFLLAAALGSFSVVSISFLQKTFNSGTVWAPLCMFLGAGLFAGSLLYGKFGQRFSQFRIIFFSLILSGIMLMVSVYVIWRHPDFRSACLLSAMLGFLVSPILSAPNTIIHSVSENGMMGKVFSSLEVVMHLGFLIFMVISSILAERFSHESILIGAGAVFVVLGTVGLIAQRKIT